MLAAGLFAACGTAQQNVGINAVPAQLTKAVAAADKACAGGGCTREACYTRITTQCVNHVCTGTLVAPRAVAL